MINKRIYRAGTLAAIAMAAGCSKTPTVSFSTDVMPVLDRHCKECHEAGGAGTQRSGFAVDSYDSVMAGTKLGPMVVPGDPLSSNLYRLVAGEVDESIRMPHQKSALTDEEIEVISTWIAEGAPDN
ncbi:MAG: hypothetical protein PVJ66_02270 [Gammaproteobacteria bacterium]|jgi:hypothetical protein